MRFQARRNIYGLSLIELMIALVIGIVLLLGVVQVFAASRESYRLSDGLARVQENARFAMYYLQRDIRMAGHFGCVNDQARSRVPNGFVSHFSVAPLNFQLSIRGYDGAPTTGDVPVLMPAPLAGRDSVVLRFLSGNGTPVTGLSADTITFDADKWSALTTDGVAAPTLFGIADCSRADVFAAESASSAGVVVPGGMSLAPFSAATAGGRAMLYRAEAIIYYIANGTGGRPSLYRARINSTGSAATSEEIVEGVENLQLRYGQDALNAESLPTGYISTQGDATDIGDAVDEWARVGQVQIGLVLASPERASATASSENLQIFGEDIVAENDGRYRATYHSTVALRNRLYGN